MEYSGKRKQIRRKLLLAEMHRAVPRAELELGVDRIAKHRCCSPTAPQPTWRKPKPGRQLKVIKKKILSYQQAGGALINSPPADLKQPAQRRRPSQSVLSARGTVPDREASRLIKKLRDFPIKQRTCGPSASAYCHEQLQYSPHKRPTQHFGSSLCWLCRRRRTAFLRFQVCAASAGKPPLPV